jgi:hypothetical protein
VVLGNNIRWEVAMTMATQSADDDIVRSSCEDGERGFGPGVVCVCLPLVPLVGGLRVAKGRSDEGQ